MYWAEADVYLARVAEGFVNLKMQPAAVGGDGGGGTQTLILSLPEELMITKDVKVIFLFARVSKSSSLKKF